MCLTTPFVIVLPSTFWDIFNKASALLTCTMHLIVNMRPVPSMLNATCCLMVPGPLQRDCYIAHDERASAPEA